MLPPAEKVIGLNVFTTLPLRLENVPLQTLAQLVEALRYKPEGRGFDSR
jgi:hypothetical protein